MKCKKASNGVMEAQFGLDKWNRGPYNRIKIVSKLAMCGFVPFFPAVWPAMAVGFQSICREAFLKATEIQNNKKQEERS